MKLKLFFFTLAALLFGYCGAYAEPINGDGDTLWTKYMSGVTDIKFHPSGETVLVAHETQGVVILNANDGTPIKTYEMFGNNNQLQNIQISNNGKYLFGIYIENGDLAKGVLWNYETGEILRKFDESVFTACISPTSEKIYCRVSNQKESDYNIWIYDIEKNEIAYHQMFPEADYISTIATSPDGKYFAVAGLFTNFGETTSTLALYDATTFEKIGNIVEGLNGSIEKIQFSEHSKWMIINTHVSFGEVINLEEFLEKGTTNRNKFYLSLSLKFLKDEKHIIFGSNYNNERTYIVNFLTKDTVYYINRYLGGFEFNNSNHNFVCSDLRVSLFNSNWYYSDVPENTDTDLISNISYQNGTLNYSSSLESTQSIKITDLSGKIVFQSTALTLNNEINIALTKGIYFLTLSDGKSEYSKKFMVME